MSDVMKDAKARPPIDLDEFERQLREMQARPRHASSDPLAELARIVGQDDPFRLVQGMRTDTDQPARHADAPPQSADPSAPLRPSFEDMLPEQFAAQPRTESAQRPSYASPLDELAAISATHEPGETGPAPDFLAARHHTGDAEDELPADEGRFAYEEPQKRSRAGVAIFMGLVVFGLAGVGAVWSLSGPKKGTQLANADIPVIAPKPGPIKEKPLDPGGLDVPNQKTAVLEKTKDDLKAPSKVLAREEQPVDLSQAAKKDIRRVDLGQAGPTGAPPVTIVSVPTAPVAPPAAVAAAPAVAPVSKPPEAPIAKVESKPDTPQTASVVPSAIPSPPEKPAASSAAPSDTAAPSLGAPKRVKSIRFNANGEPADQPATAALAPASPPAPTPPSPPAKIAVKAVPAAPVAPAAPKPAPKPIASRELVKESAVPVPAPAIDANAPLQISPPAGVSRKASISSPTTPIKRPAPKSVQTALAAPATDEAAVAGDDTSLSTPTSTTSISSGGARKFSVQFGAPGTTGEASALISKLKSQYPSVMGSVSPRVIKAEVNGKSFYRVRSGAVSREEAGQICSQLKSAGGTCFVSGA